MSRYLSALFFLISILLQNSNSVGQVPCNEFIITDTISSKILDQDRIIDIYLPANYFNTNDRCAIQIIIGHKQRSSMYYALSNYLGEPYHVENGILHTIPETIVIGFRTLNGGRELRYEDDWKSISKFISQELITYISEKYRTNGYKTLIGHSVGGGFVLKSMFSGSVDFNAYYCTAPTESKYLVALIKEGFSQNDIIPTSKKRLILACGKNDKEIPFIENKELIDELSKISNENFSFRNIELENADHHSIFPSTITDALLFMFEDWRFDLTDSQTDHATELLVEHYKNLSNTTGISITPPENDFYLLTYLLFTRNNTNEKISVLKKCKEYYPKALMADAYLARTYYMIDDFENAMTFNKIALQLNPENKFAIETQDMLRKKSE